MAIIVLGAAVWSGGGASPSLARRIAHAVRLARRHPDALIVATGGLGAYPPAEAVVIARDMQSAGVSPSRVLQDRWSRNTYENIRFARRLLHSPGVTDVILVTDRYHMLRARMTARALGLSARGASVPWSRDMSRAGLARAWLREAVALPIYALRLWIMSRSGRH